MKRVILVFIFILNICLFCGCVDVSYMVEYKSNGEITQTFSVAIDKEKLEENGYSYVDVSATIVNLYSNYWQNKQNQMEENLNKHVEISQQEKSEILLSIKKDISVNENNIIFVLSYPNRQIASLVNTDPESEENDDDVSYVDNYFTKTMVQDVTNIYDGYYESELYLQLNNLYNQNNEFNDNDITLKHIIAFSTNRYKSNADKIVSQNGLFYHIWNINSSKDINGEYATTKMKLYVTTAKPSSWYIFAIVLTSLFIVISLIYVKIPKKQQNILK